MHRPLRPRRRRVSGPPHPLSDQATAKTRHVLARPGACTPGCQRAVSAQGPSLDHAVRGRRDTNPMRDDLSVSDSVADSVSNLVTRARNGEKHAWDALVDRYAPLIWSICRRHGLGRADTEDVGQAVWLYLVGHLGTLHE